MSQRANIFYGNIPAGYVIPGNTTVPYPPPAHFPVALQPAPANFYPAAVQYATSPPPTAGPGPTMYAAPPPPAPPSGVPAAWYNPTYHAQQPQFQAAPGVTFQYPSATLGTTSGPSPPPRPPPPPVAAPHAPSAPACPRYYFGNPRALDPRPPPAPTRKPEDYAYGFVKRPEPYAYGIVDPPIRPAPRPVSPTDYGSGDPLGRRYGYMRR